MADSAAIEGEGDTVVADATGIPDTLLRNRSFQALWSSEAFAGLADNAATVVYPLLVLSTTGSAAYAGAVGSLQLLTTGVMSFWGGVLADRLGRKRMLVGCAFIRAVLLGLFTLATLTGTANVFLILGVAMLSACFGGLAMPAGMALVKQLVRGDQVARATTQNQVRWFGAITVGPSLGGVLYGVAKSLPFVAVFVSYAVSTVLGLFIRDTGRPERAEPGRRGWLEGLRYLVREPVLRPVMISIILSNLAFNTTGMTLAIVAIGKSRHATDSFIGFTVTTAGSGALVGALLAGFIIKRFRPSTLFMAGYWIGPIAAALLMIVPGVYPLGVIVACLYLRGPVINALFLTYTTKTVPNEIQGKVLGAIVSMSTVVSPLGVFAIGAIFDAVGPVAMFAVVGSVSLLAAIPTLSRSVRTLPAATIFD